VLFRRQDFEGRADGFQMTQIDGGILIESRLLRVIAKQHYGHDLAYYQHGDHHQRCAREQRLRQ
jgi:hypothetical protein